MPRTRIPVAIQRAFDELVRAAAAEGRRGEVVAVLRTLADLVTTSSVTGPQKSDPETHPEG
ncbi:hypothetical protein LLS1_01410 [Leifsonia sp. LS1]|nr:hypothetical protein LLS1_01410 [Leifsonia sp. LS1]